MTGLIRSRLLVLCLLLITVFIRAEAIELLQFVEGGDHARILQKANGLTITDDGVVFISSTEKGSLLKVTQGNIQTFSLTPSVFKDTDLGGVAMFTDGRLVVINQDDGQVAVLDADMHPLELFSQSGRDAGELDDPRSVAVSINEKIYVGDFKNKRVSVFNNQGLFLYTIGQELLRPTHVSIDAEENVYVLEGPTRLSIFSVTGELIARFSAKDLKPFFGETPEFSAMTADLDGNLYIGDEVQSRVTVFDWRNQKVLGQFGSLGQSRAQYREISDLSVNAVGQIAVLDKKNGKVEVFQLDQSSSATPVARDLLQHGGTIDSNCEARYSFIDAKTLCITPGRKGIVILDEDGSEQGAFAEAAKNPAAIHVGANSVGILGKDKLYAFDHDGNTLFSIGRYGSRPGL